MNKFVFIVIAMMFYATFSMRIRTGIQDDDRKNQSLTD